MKMDGGTNRPKVLISRQETKGKAARTVVIVLSVGARKKKQIRATTSPPFATRVRTKINCSCFGGRGVFANKDLFVIEELGAPEQTL
jgi:hypothetical protein